MLEYASRPARGAWVEIERAGRTGCQGRSRPARGAWVEINKGLIYSNMGIGRAPQGARGLKFLRGVALTFVDASRPSRGAWIEMPTLVLLFARSSVAPLAGRVD